MKIYKLTIKAFVFGFAALVAASCADHLTELNQNPNGIDPATANPNQIMPTVMTAAARDYISLGYGDVGGTMQFTQKDGWYTGHNQYDWSPRDWSNWYNMLRNNNFLNRRATELGYKFHEAVSLTMRAFIFGTITDLWGDAPYTEAVQGNISNDLLTPKFDSQEIIYDGIIEDLKAAAAIFATGDRTGLATTYDVFFAGNTERWQKFTHTLLLRYYMRISVKKEAVARAGIESIYSSGVYMKTSADDAMMDYIGAVSGDSWPETTKFDLTESGWRRIKPGQAIIDQLLGTSDPRLKVWFAPVHVRWVADETLATDVDDFIRKNGEIQNNVRYLTDLQYRAEIAAGARFTRHFNPNRIPSTLLLDTNEYVGIPAGALDPSAHNYNPNPGQQVENQHASQLAAVFRNANGGILKARLASSAETEFVLAEAALKGWNVGSAETHYKAGIKNSLDAWGVGGDYDAFVAQEGVVFDNTVAQVLTQKWVGGFTSAMESWFDYRRTGLPALQAGPAAQRPVLPVRFIYGDNEQNFNYDSFISAVNRLEENSHTVLRGKNSQWSKPWLLQGTNQPWQ